MTLIQSISGIRGTMGGRPGESLTPVDVIRFTGAYGMWLIHRHAGSRLTVVTGRDARVSGHIISNIVVSVLQAMGIEVIDAGLTTTPTVAMSVKHCGAHGGIIITASHNPSNWNALKLLNEHGEFMTETEGQEMAEWIDLDALHFVPTEKFGKYVQDETLLETHIEKVLDLPLVDADAIRKADFRIVVDGINSSGGIAVPLLLQSLGVRQVYEVNCEPTGLFQHNPEPLPEHLQVLAEEVLKLEAHAGFAVDPDVDRLAIVQEDGACFGEEYTLVSVANYVLSKTPGNTVSNLSSTQALAEITQANGCRHFYTPVGEVNVVAAMKKHHAVIGGEGNGGVIYPELHYGRDALVGIALFLTQMAQTGLSCSKLKKKLPQYHLSKNKVELPDYVNIEDLMARINEKYKNHHLETADGLKIWFEKDWVHLRSSNTEPVIRLYVESDSEAKAESIAGNMMNEISQTLKDL